MIGTKPQYSQAISARKQDYIDQNEEEKYEAAHNSKQQENWLAVPEQEEDLMGRSRALTPS